MHPVEREEFEAMMWRAVEALPPEIRERIENVAFMVEERQRPGDDPDRGTTGRGRVLLGLYRGVPLTQRGSGYHMALPDQIVLFQAPLQRMARDAEHLESLVAHTVRHEVGHYFGISDDRLRELGAY